MSHSLVGASTQSDELEKEGEEHLERTGLGETGVRIEPTTFLPK